MQSTRKCKLHLDSTPSSPLADEACQSVDVGRSVGRGNEQNQRLLSKEATVSVSGQVIRNRADHLRTTRRRSQPASQSTERAAHQSARVRRPKKSVMRNTAEAMILIDTSCRIASAARFSNQVGTNRSAVNQISKTSAPSRLCDKCVETVDRSSIPRSKQRSRRTIHSLDILVLNATVRRHALR